VAFYFEKIDATYKERQIKAVLLSCIYVPKDSSDKDLQLLAHNGYEMRNIPTDLDYYGWGLRSGKLVSYCQMISATGHRTPQLGEYDSVGLDTKLFSKPVAVAETDIRVPISIGDNMLRAMKMPFIFMGKLFKGLMYIGVPKVSG